MQAQWKAHPGRDVARPVVRLQGCWKVPPEHHLPPQPTVAMAIWGGALRNSIYG